VTNNMKPGTGTISPLFAVIANLAVESGIVSEPALLNWATGNNIQVNGIFTAAPAVGTQQITESFATAVNDPLLTSDGGAPTLAYATAQTEINSQASSMPENGPAPIAGMSTYAQEIQEAYVAYYGRPADAGGLTYWADQLTKAGGNLDAVIAAFGNSPESQGLYGGQSSAQMITSIYGQELGRAPDANGLAYWTAALASGAVSPAAAALAILQGTTGTDQTLVSNKLVVAEAFTDIIENDSATNALYSGDAAATNARAYLGSVTASAATAVILSGIAGQIAHAIQDGTSIANDITGVGVTLVGQTSSAAIAHTLIHA
jgi:hypothetical protein